MPGLPPVSPILTSETVIHQFSVGYSQQECLLAWGPQSLLTPTLTSNSRQNFAQHKSNTALFFSSYSEEKPKNPNDPCFLIHRSDFVFDICLPPLLCRTLSSHCSVSSTPAHTTFLLWHKLFPQIRHKFHLDFWADTTLLKKPFLFALWRWGVHLSLGCFYSVLWLLWICHMWPVSSLCNLSPSTIPFSYPRSSLAARSSDAPSSQNVPYTSKAFDLSAFLWMIILINMYKFLKSHEICFFMCFRNLKFTLLQIHRPKLS